MPQALIEINSVAGSDDDLPINTLVQLSNADIGGEITYFWEILDQPEGTADVLSSTAIENPTFTPKKEGTYLIRLTVNDTLASEVSNLAIAAVRQFKTNERIPAAMETVEADPAKGWKTAANRLLQVATNDTRDSNIYACKNAAAGFPVIGSIVKFSLSGTIKTGLPGQETLPVVEKAPATLAANMLSPLGIVVGTPTGAAAAANGVVLVRRFGLVEVVGAGFPVVGDLVFVSDTATPALVAGTVRRVLGRVVNSAAGAYLWMIDGSVGADWESIGDVHGDRTDSTIPTPSFPMAVSAAWQQNSSGYLQSIGGGLAQHPIPMRLGNRLKELTFNLVGDGVADLTTTVYTIPNTGAAATSIGTVTTLAHGATADIVLPVVNTVLLTTFAFLIQWQSSAANLEIRNVRWRYDRP